MDTGTVKWFDDAKGFGFISPDDGSSDVFVHISAIGGGDQRSLKEGQRVEYDTGRGRKGVRAITVRRL
jgi:CspA family cold shock protein